MLSVKKAVFPVAGLGTRFLPATKVVAKEMLPVLDRPLIQYAVDEAVDAGAETLHVAQRSKRLGDHIAGTYAQYERAPRVATPRKRRAMSAPVS